MVDEIDLTELVRAVEQVRESYRTPLPRLRARREAPRNGGEFCEPKGRLRSGE
jgi:hypothetical protein